MQPAKRKGPFNPGRWSGKPYRFFGDYLWETYGCRVLKIPLNAGLSCPNRDGTIGTEGCSFCADDASSPPLIRGVTDIRIQAETIKKNFRRSDERTRFIAYFQAYTNTNASVERLRSLYDSAIADEDITGLMIGTRPDCLPEKCLDLIASYRKPGFELWLELGMQTMHEPGLKFLNRCHGHEATRDAVVRARARDISVCLHLILGIPGESWTDIMETASEINRLGAQGVKFHQLHIIRGTRMAEYHERGLAPALSLKEYVSLLCDFMERLSPDVLIHRISGDRDAASLVAPLWGHRKGTVAQAVLDEFERRGTYQGFLFPD